MRLLYVASRFDYGKPAQGESFEHANFFDTLVRMAGRTIHFDFPTVIRETGSVGAMNRKLIEVARTHQPDLMFCVLTGDEIRPATLRAVRDAGVISLNWFCDDHWRFDGFTRRYAPCFDHVVTTADELLARYRDAGFQHVLLSQWACNPRKYPRVEAQPQYDVSFVGMAHGRRRRLVAKLQEAGLRVGVFGSGWNTGRLTHAGMVRLFAQSRVNLNFSEASTAAEDGPLQRAVHRMRQAMLQCPGLWRLAPGSALGHVGPRQIKARTFEVPAVGGFLLTQDAPCLHEYLTPGKEVAVFDDDRDLVDRVRYYLDHEDERRAIAQAGHARVLRDHTYALRFRKLFTQIGLAEPATPRRAA